MARAFKLEGEEPVFTEILKEVAQVDDLIKSLGEGITPSDTHSEAETPRGWLTGRAVQEATGAVAQFQAIRLHSLCCLPRAASRHLRPALSSYRRSLRSRREADTQRLHGAGVGKPALRASAQDVNEDGPRAEVPRSQGVRPRPRSWSRRHPARFSNPNRALLAKSSRAPPRMPWPPAARLPARQWLPGCQLPPSHREHRP